MAINIPANGGCRILYRPQPNGPIHDIRHFWTSESTGLGTLYTWVIGHVIDGNFYPFPENVVQPSLAADITFAQLNYVGGKGAWYVNKMDRVNLLLDRYADVTPDDFVPNGDFDLENDNVILQGYFRMKPHPTDTQPLMEVYYRPNPLDPLPTELWNYT